MKKIFTPILLVACCFVFSFCSEDRNKIISEATKVIERQIGEKANHIQFELLPTDDGRDVYQIEAKKGQLYLSGSSSVAICYAFYTYLKDACHNMIAWSGKHLELPKVWPDYKKTKVVSPYSLRYYLNVCTFGYTSPYWDWKRWEEEIDWMAMHGFNMPLATVASEAIAEKVWLKMGLSKKEIRSFFTSPAYLPWHRMGNMSKWGGPLSDSWMESQIELQHRIIERMKSLGMKPIAPAFAGFIPKGFIKKHPEMAYNHLQWGGFDEDYTVDVLPPNSPYFKKTGKLFIKEWEKEFGKNTYYLSDSFNEMKLPIDKNNIDAKHQILADYGEAIYASIKAGNPEAIWVTQGWTFGYQHDFWDKKSMQALLSRVPDDKMIIIDLGNEFPKWVWNTRQTWKVHDGFYGKKWIFSYVPNFGGKTLLTGDLNLYASSSVKALKSSNKGYLVGFGCAPEGLENNEIVYDLIADMGWRDKKIDLDVWISSYCTARYGAYPRAMKEAFKLFRKTVYGSYYSYPRYTFQTIIPDSHRVSKVDKSLMFKQGVIDFLSCANELRNSDLYTNDALFLSANYVAIEVDSIYQKALDAKEKGNVELSKKLLDKTIDKLLIVDKLLADLPNNQLSEWIEKARNFGETDFEKDKYESDAKRLITTWGGRQEDYAARFWGGLIKDYYIPRLKIYFSKGKDEVNKWEEGWIQTPWKEKKEVFENPLNIAIKMLTSKEVKNK